MSKAETNPKQAQLGCLSVGGLLFVAFIVNMLCNGVPRRRANPGASAVIGCSDGKPAYGAPTLEDWNGSRTQRLADDTPVIYRGVASLMDDLARIEIDGPGKPQTWFVRGRCVQAR